MAQQTSARSAPSRSPSRTKWNQEVKDIESDDNRRRPLAHARARARHALWRAQAAARPEGGDGRSSVGGLVLRGVDDPS